MMAGVCLLALVLTFTIAECGPSQEKRQESPTQTPLCQECVRECESTWRSPNECAEICDCYDVKGGGAPGDDGNGPNYDNVPDEDNGLDEDNGSDDNNGSDSGAAVGRVSIQDSGPGGAHAGGGPDGPDYDNGSDDGNVPNDGNGFDDGNGPSDGNGFDDGDGPSDGNGSNDNNGSDDDNGSVSGAVVAGATIISALLVAVASAMN